MLDVVPSAELVSNSIVSHDPTTSWALMSIVEIEEIRRPTNHRLTRIKIDLILRESAPDLCCRLLNFLLKDITEERC